MDAGRTDPALEAVGVRPGDQALYRALLERPGSTAGALATATGRSPGSVRRGLARLEDLGLLSRSPGVPRCYSPTLPEAALEALLHAHEQELEQVRIAAAELTATYRACMPGGKPAELVEVVSGREAVARRFLQLQKAAREEMLVFDAPPYATPANVVQREVLARGVRYRAVYAAAALELPGRLEAVLELAAAGERARVLPGVPVKLAVADRALALLPASLQRGRLGEGAVVVHASPLLEALVTLFELLWDRAVPLPAPRPGGVDGPAGGADAGGVDGPAGGADAGGVDGPVGGASAPDGGEALEGSDELVLALLVAGCKDDAIARRLGISPRTVRRRVRRLMDRLGAGTRFQAGLQAARRGWV